MLTWVVYDIGKDRTRTRIARRCLDFGLYRVQKSVFEGRMSEAKARKIAQRIERARFGYGLSCVTCVQRGELCIRVPLFVCCCCVRPPRKRRLVLT